jgi:hypothetical protein
VLEPPVLEPPEPPLLAPPLPPLLAPPEPPLLAPPLPPVLAPPDPPPPLPPEPPPLPPLPSATRPRPTQQGSSPQIGEPADAVEPMGSQQQHPLQSVQVESVALGLQTSLHVPPLVWGASLSSLPHAARPTVEEAPVTTRTWKSLSSLMAATVT